MSISFSLILICILLSLLQPIQADTHDDVHHRMDDLVDSVKNAVHDADSVGHKREVVDLGQTLHLLETKFAGLRTALEAELGTKADKFSSHHAVAKDLMDRSSELVQGIVTQREELRKLQADIKEIDSAVRAIKEGMVTFERDSAELSKIMSEVHESHNDITEQHSDTKHAMNNLFESTKQSKGGMGPSMFWYILLMAEVAIFVLFLYLKRPASSMAHKAYGKFG